MKQEMTGWQWHQPDHMQIVCTSLQTNNFASTSKQAASAEFRGQLKIKICVCMQSFSKITEMLIRLESEWLLVADNWSNMVF